MTGQSVGSDASRLSCFLFRPRKSREKRRKRSYTNVSSTLSTRSSTPPAQTPHVRFHERTWVHTRLSEKDRTQGLTRRNRGCFGWGRYYYPRSVSHVHKHPQAWYQNGVLCRFWVLVGGTPKERREPRDSDALMRVAVPRRRGPAGLRDLFRFCRNRDLYIRRSWFSACARWGWYYYPRSVSHGSEPLRGRDLKRQTLPLLGLGRGAPEERRKPAGQRCAYARRCSEASRPRRAA